MRLIRPQELAKVQAVEEVPLWEVESRAEKMVIGLEAEWKAEPPKKKGPSEEGPFFNS